MTRARLAGAALSFVYLTGCSSSELNDLRASVAKYKHVAEEARSEATAAAANAAAATEDAQTQISRAENLSRDAAAQLAAAESERDAAAAA